MSSRLKGLDDAFERALFDRRAQVCDAGAGVPSLESVLRAARVDAGERSSGRGRALRGLVLAAACLVTVAKAHPREIPGEAIVADVGGETPASFELRGGLCEAQPASLLPAAATYATIAPRRPALLTMGAACVDPRATFASSGGLSCERDDSAVSELR